MSSLSFFILVLCGSLAFAFPALFRLPIRLRVLNLPVIFSFLFLLYYATPFVVSEAVLGFEIPHWLPLDAAAKSEAIRFLAAYFAAFWVGFLLFSSRTSVESGGRSEYSTFVPHLVLFALVPAFVVYVYATGGWVTFFENHRDSVYADQWSDDPHQILINRVRILSTLIMMVGVLVGGYLAGSRTDSPLWLRVAYHLAPLPITLVKWALISRGVFLFYVLFFVVKFVTRDRESRHVYILLPIAVLLVFYGAVNAFNVRDDGSSAPDNYLWGIVNSANGMSSYLDSFALAGALSFQGLRQVLIELVPVPSFLFSDQYQNNLTVLVFGVAEGSSAPMPFIGEAYYNLQWFALLLAVGQGVLCAVVSRRLVFSSGSERGWWIAFYVSLAYSFIYMPHSGLRSCTRLLAWTFTFYFLWQFWEVLRKCVFLRPAG